MPGSAIRLTSKAQKRHSRIFNYLLAPVYGGAEFGLPQTMAQMADKHKIKVVRDSVWHPNTCGSDLKKAEEIVRKYFDHG